MIIGATVNSTDYGYGEKGWVRTAQQFDEYLSGPAPLTTQRPMALTKGKYFFQEAQFGFPAGMQQLAGAGVHFLACMKPGRTGFTDKTNPVPDPAGASGYYGNAYTAGQLADFAACLALLKSSAVVFDVVLWQEPNDNDFFPDAAEYAKYVAYYGPVVTGAGLNLVYCAGGSNMTTALDYYPGNGPGYEFNVIICDFYDHGWLSGTILDPLAGLADTLGLPFGLGEFGNNHVSATEAQWADFVSYLTQFFAARQAAGLANYGAFSWNTNIGDDTFTGIVGYAPGDTRGPPYDWKVPYMQNMYDVLTATAGPAPYDVCNATQAAGNTVFDVTAGTGAAGTPKGTAGGDLVYVALSGSASGQSVVSVNDTGGNVYQQVNGYAAGSQQDQWLYASQTTTALTSGVDQILVVFGLASGTKGMIARGCTGVTTVAPDQSAVSHGDSASPSVTSGQLEQSSELAVGIITVFPSGSAPTGVSFGTVRAIQPGNYLTLFDDITSTAAPVVAGGSITAATWSASVTTFPYGSNPPPPAPSLAQPLVIPFFPAGYAPQNTDFNSWVQAPFQFLTSKVVFRAALATTSTPFPAGANTPVVFDQVNEDPYGGWMPAAGAWQCPPGMSGTYEITLTAAAQAAADNVTTLQANIALNGTNTWTCSNIWMPSTQIGIASGTAQLQLAGGQDQVSAVVWWNGTADGTASLAAGRRCTIEITWFCL